MSWDQFSKLDPECKNSEIQRLLPLVSSMSEDIVSIQRDCNTVHTKLHEIKNNHENQKHQESYIRETEPNAARTEEMSVFSASTNVLSEKSNPDPSLIAKSRSMSKRVKLNVGG